MVCTQAGHTVLCPGRISKCWLAHCWQQAAPRLPHPAVLSVVTRGLERWRGASEHRPLALPDDMGLTHSTHMPANNRL